MFAYCENNPVNNQDPTGEILITTLILIGAAVVGAGVTVYTGVKAREAGCGWGETILHSAINGMMAFFAVYSFGMTAYGCYQEFCYLHGMTPVTEIGGISTEAQLQNCADQANASIHGSGPVVGTQKHSAFAENVNKLGDNSLRTEVSYLNGQEVPYGTKGSIRFDVLQFKNGIPVQAWDFKTGSAVLTSSRIITMQRRSGLSIPISMIK